MTEGDAQALAAEHDTRFVLFVAATAPSALRAMHNLEQCMNDNGLAPQELEIIDVLREPARALEWRVFATPALIRRAVPDEWLYGDLAEADVLARFLLRDPAKGSEHHGRDGSHE